MTTQQLINGLIDLEQRNIPTDCILDMSPVIADKLRLLKRIEDNNVIINLFNSLPDDNTI